MWSSEKNTSQGGTLRHILKIVFASLVAIFLWVGFIYTAPAGAAPGEWSGTRISFDDREFTPVGKADGTKPPGIPTDSPFYVHIDGTRASIIYFPPGTDVSVPSSGNLVNFSYDTNTGKYTNPSAVGQVELPAQNITSSSCEIGFGVGWWICPVSNALASAMDYLSGVISSFLEVQPLNVTNTDDNLFKAWDAMRQIANVAFIIVFLVIIYSQLTSFGVSNYGIKKLLPSIIVGALLVNLSWIIAAAAVDLSNIIGYSLQDFFMTLRGDLFSFGSADQSRVEQWSSITQTALTGGAIATGGVLAAVSFIEAGSIWLLLPVLVGLILSAVVVIIIFAARQALIIVLIIIAPLAFIARILPNTESLYKKWQSTFITMLVFFPAISLLFGGAQLAGGLIIQNATTFNIVILGMAVQVAPLVLAPFVLKLSGGLLGRLAGMINDPKKGLLDRTKNYAKDRNQLSVNKRLAGVDRKGNPINPKRRTPFNDTTRKLNARKMRRSDQTEAFAKMGKARMMGDDRYKDIYRQTYEGDQALKTAESTLERDLKKSIQTDSRLLKVDLDVRLKTKQADLQNLHLENIYEKMAAGNGAAFTNLSDIANGSEKAARDLSLVAMAKNNSQRIQHTNLSDALLKNTGTIKGESLRDFAGGADTAYGADSALASAVSIQNENDGKLANERTKLISHFNLNGKQRQELAMGKKLSSPVFDDKGYSYTFDASTDDYLRSSAAELQFTKGSSDDKLEIIKSTGISKKGVKGVNYDIRTSISDLVATTGVPNSVAWLGGVSMDKITRGEVSSDSDLEKLAFEHIMGGRFKAEQWYLNDPTSIDIAIKVMKNASSFAKSAKERAEFTKGSQSLQRQLAASRTNSNITGRASDGTLNKIDELIKL